MIGETREGGELHRTMISERSKRVWSTLKTLLERSSRDVSNRVSNYSKQIRSDEEMGR